MCFALTAGAAHAQDWPELPVTISIQSNAISWAPAPPSLPQGAEIAILEGDPTQEEAHTFRLRLPDGSRVAPHSHPIREHITVLEGTPMMSSGETVDEADAAA